MKLFKWIFFFTVIANVALVILIKSNHQENYQANINLNAVQDGDIVLRDSRSLIGTQFKMMSQQDKRFSHAGIIRKENGITYVYHMANENGQSGLIKTSFNAFTNNAVCREYEIVRYPMQEQARTGFLNQIEFVTQHKIHFDDEFLLNNQSYYCSELIADLVNKFSSIHIPYSQIGDYKYYAIDNLYYHLPVQLIYKSNEIKIN